VNLRTVDRTLFRGPEDSTMLSRQAALDDASESTIVTSVLEMFRMDKAVTPKALLEMVPTNHNSRLTRRGSMLSLAAISISFNFVAHCHRRTRD
jgi:hypothetical protein